jgi:hypothetical protein
MDRTEVPLGQGPLELDTRRDLELGEDLAQVVLDGARPDEDDTDIRVVPIGDAPEAPALGTFVDTPVPWREHANHQGNLARPVTLDGCRRDTPGGMRWRKL